MESIVVRDGKRISLSEDINRLEKKVAAYNSSVSNRGVYLTASITALISCIIVIVICFAVDYTTKFGWWKSSLIAIGSGVVAGGIASILLVRNVTPHYVKRNSISTYLD